MESALSESDVAVEALIKSFAGLIETAQALGTLGAKRRPNAGRGRPRATARRDLETDGRGRRRLPVLRQADAAPRPRALQPVDAGDVRVRSLPVGRARSVAQLFTTLRRLYRTEEERQIFKLMVEGATAEEAREPSSSRRTRCAGPDAGEIEIF